MRLCSCTLAISSLLLVAMANGAKATAITANALTDMSEYDMSDSDGIASPFGFPRVDPPGSNTPAPLLQTVYSATFSFSINQIIGSGTIMSMFLNYNPSSVDPSPLNGAANHHVCDQFSPTSVSVGAMSITCTFTTPFAMPDYSFWYVGFDGLPPGSQGQEPGIVTNAATAQLTFNDAPATVPEPVSFLVAGAGLVLLAVFGRKRRLV